MIATPHGLRHDHRSVTSRIGSFLLSITAVIGVVCIVSTIAAVAFDVRPLVFRSGSMSPSIATGAVAIARNTPASDLAVGDVVSVVGSDGVRITHRIETVTVADDVATLVLKGDANASPDSAPYQVASADRVVLDIPRLGYVVAWLSGPGGVMVGSLVVGASVLVIAASGLRGSAPGGRRALGVLVVLALGAGAGPRIGPQDTLAYFTDDATLTSTTSSHKVTSQAQPVCANATSLLGSGVRLSWAQVNSRYEYYWELRRTDNDKFEEGGVVGAGVAQGQSVTLDIYTNLIGGGSRNYDVVIRARLVSPTSWVATATTTTPVRSTSLGGLVGLAVRCGHA